MRELYHEPKGPEVDNPQSGLRAILELLQGIIEDYHIHVQSTREMLGYIRPFPDNEGDTDVAPPTDLKQSSLIDEIFLRLTMLHNLNEQAAANTRHLKSLL